MKHTKKVLLLTLAAVLMTLTITSCLSNSFLTAPPQIESPLPPLTVTSEPDHAVVTIPPNGGDEDSDSNETYVFTGGTHIEVGSRSLTFEDVPKSSAEDVVAKNFLYSITGEFERKYDILADIEPHLISIENETKQFEEGFYLQTYIIHKITTLTEEQYSQEYKEDGDYNLLIYYGWQERINQYGLIKYEIVNVEFTQTHSPKSLDKGPQWGNGTYSRNFCKRALKSIPLLSDKK